MMFTIPEVFVDYPNPISVTHGLLAHQIDSSMASETSLIDAEPYRSSLHQNRFAGHARGPSWATWHVCRNLASKDDNIPSLHEGESGNL